MFFFSEKFNNLPQYTVQMRIFCSGIFSLESDFEQGKEKHNRKHERPEINSVRNQCFSSKSVILLDSILPFGFLKKKAYW